VSLLIAPTRWRGYATLAVYSIPLAVGCSDNSTTRGSGGAAGQASAGAAGISGGGHSGVSGSGGGAAGQPSAGAAGISGGGHSGVSGLGEGTAGDTGDAGIQVLSGLRQFQLQDDCLKTLTILPEVDGGGEANCQILLSGVTAGCNQPGLSPASAGDVTELTGTGSLYGETIASPVCVLDQLAAPSGVACAAESAPGWCYVRGSCSMKDGGSACENSFCTTPALDAAPVAYQSPPWIYCK
jgi:hypothetical protein